LAPIEEALEHCALSSLTDMPSEMDATKQKKDIKSMVDLGVSEALISQGLKQERRCHTFK
jgi:hypothetical protein